MQFGRLHEPREPVGGPGLEPPHEEELLDGDQVVATFIGPQAGTAQGSSEVYLVDILEGHCGPNPRLTWRVFTSEEPGRWTNAGRF